MVRNCEIRDGKSVGVSVIDQGLGTIEQCVISGNGQAGVEVRRGGNPVIRECEIRDGNGAGVLISEQGAGTFTGNRLNGNALGEWDIGLTAGRFVRKQNTPNGAWWDRFR